MERCLDSGRSAATNRAIVAAGYGFAAASALRRQPGMTGRNTDNGSQMSRRGARSMLPSKGDTGAVWPRTGLLTKHHNIGALPYRGGSRDKNNLRNAGQRPPPSTGPSFQLPHMTLGTGFVKSRRGVEKPKWTEQPKIDANGRSKRGEDTARSDRVDLRRRGTQGRLRSAEGDFFLRFPPSRRGLRSFTPLYNHTHRPPQVGQHRRPRHRRGSSPPGGRGASARDSKGSATVVRVRVRTVLRTV